MSKRQFLSPLAISLAALIATTPVVAAPTQTTEKPIVVRTSENKLADSLVLRPAKIMRLAQYDDPGHYSHSSHSSHSSHYSSRY